MPKPVSDKWSSRVRLAFWIIGSSLGAVLAYTTRFYLGGDALTFIERGDYMFRGEWTAFISYTEGPVYSILLGLGRLLLNANELNEALMLKAVNYVIFLFAMGACDLLMTFVARDLKQADAEKLKPLPVPAVTALCYSMFLFTSLALLRGRQMDPDMLIFGIVCACCAIVLWIREDPTKWGRYMLLGLTTGLGYLTKTFFFVFSWPFFVLAGLTSRSVRTVVVPVVLSIFTWLLVVTPLVGLLSYHAGRFTYGDVGPIAYATNIASTGKPIRLQVVHEKPKTLLYEWDVPCTRPFGYDPCYWWYGLEPRFEIPAQLNLALRNIVKVFTTNEWLLVLLPWYTIMVWFGTARFGSLRPISSFWLLVLIGLAGLGIYCQVHVHNRLIAPFLFLVGTALAVSLRYPSDNSKARSILLWGSVLLACVFLLHLGHSVVDQSLRSLTTTDSKPSYREDFLEHLAVKSFLHTKGISPGDRVGAVAGPPVYWARMAGVRIVGEIDDEEDYMGSTRAERHGAAEVLKRTGIKALVACRPSFRTLVDEGWTPVPGTRNYFVLFLR